jgi:hypothetical protein
MFKRNVPKVFWDYVRWVCETMSKTHTKAHRIDGRIPLQKVNGETVDVSNYLDFGFYDHVVHRGNKGLSESKIGRWLGVAKNVGTMMTFYVLTQTCQVVSSSSVEWVKEIEKETGEMKKNLEEFDVSNPIQQESNLRCFRLRLTNPLEDIKHVFCLR